MLRQHRWPVALWHDRFIDHPLLFPFVLRLIWGGYDAEGALLGTFRALEDRTLTTADDASFASERGHNGRCDPSSGARRGRGLILEQTLVRLRDHPALPATRSARDPGLAKTSCAERMSGEFAGTRLTVMSFRNRAEKRGWSRDAAAEGGMADCYRKVFPGSGVAAYLNLEGMYWGISLDEEITPGQCLVPAPG